MSSRKQTPLTPRASMILTFIKEYRAANNNQSPTYRQIMKAAGLNSTAATKYQIDRMIADGYLKRGRGARSLTPVGDDPVIARQVVIARQIRSTKYLTVYDAALEADVSYVVTIRKAAS